MLPIATPPYYAIAQWPGGPNTQGGPIRNAKAQVCDPLATHPSSLQQRRVRFNPGASCTRQAEAT